MPFRDAHRITGQLVALAERNGRELDQLTLEEMQAVEPGITGKALAVLCVEQSVASRTSFGGTAPARVLAAIREARAMNAAQAGASATPESIPGETDEPHPIDR
jgi:argininosuccinate lyase